MAEKGTVPVCIREMTLEAQLNELSRVVKRFSFCSCGVTRRLHVKRAGFAFGTALWQAKRRDRLFRHAKYLEVPNRDL